MLNDGHKFVQAEVIASGVASSEGQPRTIKMVVPMATPVTVAGSIDLPAAARLAEWLVKEGADAIFVCGTTGRFSDFPPAENGQLCQAVVRAVGDVARVYAGIADSGPMRMLNNALIMKEAGASAVVTTGPYYLPRSIAQVEDALIWVADRCPLPLLLYNMPELVGYCFRPDWLRTLTKHPTISGYKDSSNDLQHHWEVLDAAQSSGWEVLIGKERLLLDAIRIGASGTVVSLSHLDPALFARLTRQAIMGQWAAAEESQEAIDRITLDFMNAYGGRPLFSDLMEYLEAGLRRAGMELRLC